MITIDSIPMEVREHIMRGQWVDAIKTLEKEHDMSEDDARALIRDYRESLKERRLELEVRKMQSAFGEERPDRDEFKTAFYKKMMIGVIGFLLLLTLLSFIF